MKRFRKRSFVLPSRVLHSMRSSPFASMLTKPWRDCLRCRWNWETSRRILLGLDHEQQHQELALTDIKHAFFSNPLHPAYCATPLPVERDVAAAGLRWHSYDVGLVEIGYSLDTADPFDFCFDNGTPRHKVYLEPFQIASRNVTCREYLEFML